MRVLVTGAYGLIGSAILARLHRDGHSLVGAGRVLGAARRRFPYARWVAADFARRTTIEDWLPLLADVEAVVNCVGVLQDGARDDSRRVHVDATCALFDACGRAGVRRVIHMSALGVASAGPSEFARNKAAADAHLSGLDLDWAILRPALVLAPAVYGGTAMVRGLAGVPFVTPVVAAESRVQVVSVDDVAATVALCLAPQAPAKVVWDVAHPQILRLGEIVVKTRAWLGFAPVPMLRMPKAAARLLAVAADWLGWFGWRSPARSTAVAQLTAGVVGDPAAWMRATAIKPASFEDILAARPASVQDRWFARLYFLKPLAIASLSLYWMLTGIISLGPGWGEAMALLSPAGWPPRFVAFVIIAGALLDILFGAALLVRPLTRAVLITMVVICIPYLLAATLINPVLWLDPLGRLMKTVPVMLALLFTLAILDER
jgi:uncharacterized protein YbjT (DUF2867 family)